MAEEGYVELPFTTNTQDIEDEALAVLEAKWPDWVADDGDLSVVMFEAGAPLAANAIRLAAEMPPAALIALGTKLLQVPYNEGTPATAQATFTTASAAGSKVIPAGSELDIEGVAFQLVNALTIPEGQKEGTAEIRANDVGSFANGLAGASWAGVTLPLFVTAMKLVAPTHEGQDKEDDTEYLNRISLELRRRSKSLITLVDFEIAALEQQGVGAAWAVGLSSKPRNIVVYVKSPEGEPVSRPVKEALEAAYATTRLVNAKVRVANPTYAEIGVEFEVVALPGVEKATLQAACEAALKDALLPANYGKPTSSEPGLSWVNNPTVRVNKLIQVLSTVTGVDYVVSLSIFSSSIAQISRPIANGAPLATIHVANYAPDELAPLSAALVTGAPITSLPVNELPHAVPAGAHVYIAEGEHTQEWVVTTAAEEGATKLIVESQTPSFAFPIGAKIAGESQRVANKPVVGASIKIHYAKGLATKTYKFASEPSPGVWELTAPGNAEVAIPVGSTISGRVAGDMVLPGVAALPEVAEGEIYGTVVVPSE